MQSIELTAKSVEEARSTAAQKFGVSPAEVEVTVLEEIKGLFGKTSVRVKAESTAAAPAPTPAPEPVAVAASPEPAPAAPRHAEAAAPIADDMTVAPEASETGGEAEQESAVVATDDDAAQLLALVNQILESGDLNVNASANVSGGRYVNVELDGKDVAFLVGKHGEVLNALQYLVNIAAARKFANGVRITLDGNNYRERREAALTALATKIAEEVKARKEEAVLDALPAFERRVVHKALAAIDGVETYSEGEEPNRKVVIAPA